MGLNTLTQQNMQENGLGGIDRLAANAMFPQSQMDKTQYSVSSQMPTSAEVVNAGYEPQTNAYSGMPIAKFASGGLATLRYAEGGSAADEGMVFDEATGQWTAPVEDNPLTRNADFQNINIDIDRARELEALKASDPKAYNYQLMNELSNSLKEQYNSNSNYEPTWKQFQSLQEADPAQWHKQQLDWLGHQQGWQIGQNTSERNAAGLPVIQDEIEQAKKAGVSQEEIDSILSGSSQKANYQNQQRIINEQQAGHGPLGMTTKDYLTVAAILGSGAAAAYFAPAIAAEGAIGTAAASEGIGAGTAAGADVFGGLAGTEGAYGGLTAAEQAAAASTAAGSTAAESGLPTLKEAYNAYKYANMGKNALNALTSEGGTGVTSAYGNQAINNPYAMSSGFNPGTVAGTGLSTPVDYRAYTQPKVELTDLSKVGGIGDVYELAAGGGISTLGSYSDGGRLLKGPGDGMSDHIPAKIGAAQPARLADGEFVVPADVVSHLGNGSTDAGAKQLYSMMDKIRKARTGTKKQGKQINASKFLPQG